MDGGGEVMGEKYHSLDCAVLPFFYYLFISSFILYLEIRRVGVFVDINKIKKFLFFFFK